MEVGKPILINDDDCDVEYPSFLEDEIASATTIDNPHQPTLLLASVQLTRLHQPLGKALRSLCLSVDTFRDFDRHLVECMHLFPRQLQLYSVEPIDPRVIAPVIHFQNTRLALCRHNLSPSCSS